MRRSDHCLPSDSDKFTIKLHSLPSPLPVLFFVSPCLPSLSLATLSSPLASQPHPLAAGASSLWTRGSSSSGSLGILTGDNHNSRYTRTTVSLRPPVLSLPIPPLRAFFLHFLPVVHAGLSLCRCVCVRVWHLPLSLGLLSSLLRRVVPSSCSPSWPDHPVASATAIPQLFSSFLALVAVADFTCLPLPAVLYRGVCFLSLVFPPFSLPRRVHPFLPLASVSIFPRPMSHLPIYLPPDFLPRPPPPFILEMGTGIHETKLTITTSKQ